MEANSSGEGVRKLLDGAVVGAVALAAIVFRARSSLRSRLDSREGVRGEKKRTSRSCEDP